MTKEKQEEKVAEMEEPKEVAKTILVKNPGEFGYYKGRNYKVLNSSAKGVAIWGDTGECFALCDLFELAKKEGLL